MVFGATAVVLAFASTVFLFHLIQFCHGMSDGEQSPEGADHPPREPNLPHVEVQHIDAYCAPKLPRFFRDDPASFFVVAEAAFRRANVLTESVKADYIIANLDHDVIPHVKHLIELDPKPADIYTQIKTRLISSFSASAETRLRRLLRGEVVSEGKPSLFLTRLRALNDGSCTDNILKSVFLEQMPLQIRAILAMSNVDNLQELANPADKILEASQPVSYQVASTSVASNPISKMSMSPAPVDPFSILTEILSNLKDCPMRFAICNLLVNLGVALISVTLNIVADLVTGVATGDHLKAFRK